MFTNPFKTIEELKLTLQSVRANRDWINQQLSWLNTENKELKVLVEHWKLVSKLTFLAVAVETCFLIYLLGTV
jgi:hypothetical protein